MQAFGNQTYAYQFSVPPALHGQDVVYTFFNGANPAVVSNTVAIALQKYITSFVTTGTPSGSSIPRFQLYGSDSEVIDLNVSNISEMVDPTANARCVWWQKSLYY